MYSWTEPAACATVPLVTCRQARRGKTKQLEKNWKWKRQKDYWNNKGLWEQEGKLYCWRQCQGGHVFRRLQKNKMGRKALFSIRSHVALLQLWHFPLQLLVVCIAGCHPGREQGENKENPLLTKIWQSYCKTQFKIKFIGPCWCHLVWCESIWNILINAHHSMQININFHTKMMIEVISYLSKFEVNFALSVASNGHTVQT